jgi:hypothetical protein
MFGFILYSYGKPIERLPLWRNNIGNLLQYAGVSKSFGTGRLEWEPQMVQLYVMKCSGLNDLEKNI